ncbi:MAG TPA: response regulator [Candidatus Binatia bacterium]|nr:response regulator [Candidatus Binatia bacterium]
MSDLLAPATVTQPLRVLMVEDNPADAELCLHELQRAGYRPHLEVVRTAEEFAARISANEYDVVLGDYSLPAWTGLDALEMLRRAAKSIPFILLTGSVREEEAARCALQGGVDFVHKNSLSRVVMAVRLALERKTLRETQTRLEEKCRALEEKLAQTQRQPTGGNPAEGIRPEESVPSLATFARLNPNPVLQFSREGKLTYFNDAAGEMAKALGKTHPEDMLPPETPAILQSSLATGQKRLRVETTIGGRTLSWSFYPIKQNEVVHCYVGDITERQQLEAQLRHSQKLESVGRLAAGIAHDFNNVLTVIQGHAGLMRSDPALTSTLGDCVQQIGRAAERGSKLTSQLLAFSRRNVLQPQRLDLNEVLTSLSSLLHRTLGEDITYQFSYASDLPPVYADPGLTEQVIMNLAVNARDAMPRGGQLLISTALVDIDATYVERHSVEARGGRFVCLSLADTGCGMDSVTLHRLFEPFFTTKEFGKGTGLGLATVYGIVKQHGGWIEVSSQLGQGSTFKVFLPPDDRSDERRGERAFQEKALRGTETILVIEDESPVRWIVKDVLSKYGYHVLEAGSGVEALALWHQHHDEIALLLTDLVMPVGLSGQELAEQFTTQKPALKVIYISGYSLQVAGKGFSVLDGLNFLQKPFDDTKLALAVRQGLDS